MKPKRIADNLLTSLKQAAKMELTEKQKQTKKNRNKMARKSRAKNRKK